MENVFKDKARTRQQMRTKDQNIKAQHFTVKKNKTDLLELSYRKVLAFVNDYEEKILKNGQ
jgi:hypothetical protein